MLYTFSIPVADYRPFLEEETYRLDVEQFPRNWNDHSFLRSFGQYGERVRPGKDIPFSEKRYAKANHGIHFTNQNRGRRGGTEIIPSCVFRRVFFDSFSVRIDIGITNVCENRQMDYISEPADQIINTCKFFVSSPIYQTEYSKNKPCALYDIGGDILKQYLYATTLNPGKNYPLTKSSWLSHGCPVIVVEYEKSKLRNLSSLDTKGFRRFEQIPEEWGISLWCREVTRHIPLYVIIKNRIHDKEKVRALRVNLLKYHQERETLRAVIKLIAGRNQQLDGINTDNLSAYLNTITALYSRSKRDGIEQQPLFELMAQIEKEINQGDSSALYGALMNNPKLQFLLKRFDITIKTINQYTGQISFFANYGDIGEIIVNKNEGDVIMGDNYYAKQAGIQGPGAGTNATVYQNYQEHGVLEYDYEKMKEDIDKLRQCVKADAEIGEDDKDILVGDIAELNKAMKDKDENRIVAFMKRAGKEIYDIAKKVGCTLLAAYIKPFVGL